ncbi:uncharacterized protein LACBIDRAFT_305320 [Laccaria bicolor S238N-H82]|uniref:Predicted protein n=1 Tax=Laccaria bicolor (strain S238N-H82 / ATCC MYA-4686) TaxID=486041 RepID=B0CTY2_LACBS|nr:uncharacterized protein LACBIDRAFT_305320 [Laccaria bicolor S238N-H82]EDR14577.1 predicted protein [Laccaria bicolor S238N-H82]|eukprot:XP_001875136.1 predicted protein [Laccaria bicolor S238N-H82]
MNSQRRSFASIWYFPDVVWSLVKQREALFLASGILEPLPGPLPSYRIWI